MSSSTSSSDRAGPASGKVFVIVALVLASAALVAVEFGVRGLRGDIESQGANYVLRVLEEPGQKIIIGDSHLIPVGRPKGWLNLARGGLAAPEAARVLAARMKYFGVKKVVIESGPQILMSARQFESRALPPETLTRQIFPVPILMFEPSILDVAVRVVRDAVLSVVSSAHAAGKAGNGDADQADGARFAEMRAKQQNPTPDYAQSLVWRRHWEIVDRLNDAGVDVCLVQAPVMAAYLNAARRLDGGLYFPALEALTREAERRGIRFIAADDLARGFPDALFGNADHLNKRGGGLFWKEVETACFPGT